MLAAAAASAVCDDPNLVSAAGWTGPDAPPRSPSGAMSCAALFEHADARWLQRRFQVAGAGRGHTPPDRTDSIDYLNLPRHDRMRPEFGAVRRMRRQRWGACAGGPVRARPPPVSRAVVEACQRARDAASDCPETTAERAGADTGATPECSTTGCGCRSSAARKMPCVLRP